MRANTRRTIIFSMLTALLPSRGLLPNFKHYNALRTTCAGCHFTNTTIYDCTYELFFTSSETFTNASLDLATFYLDFIYRTDTKSFPPVDGRRTTSFGKSGRSILQGEGGSAPFRGGAFQNVSSPRSKLLTFQAVGRDVGWPHCSLFALRRAKRRLGGEAAEHPHHIIPRQ